MFDCFNRRINYLRISVTDRCNLRCTYCMPEEGLALKPHDRILSLEQIRDVVAVAISMGVDKVRLTGGEPLVRLNIVHLVEMLARMDGLADLAMTTNGVLLDQFAKPLKDAGLHRINISLDSLDPERFRRLTRCGNLSDVLRGIEAAQSAGLSPIKLNCVVERSSNEEDARSVAEFGRQHGFDVRYIRRMSIHYGTFWPVEGGDGGNCPTCNRLRLTSDGNIYPCLFNDLHYSIHELGIERALESAVGNKPASGQQSENNKFYAIGG